jgi:hypothetical protein
MKTLLGAVAGALTVGAVLVAYNLGESHTFSHDPAMVAGYQQTGNPFLMQAGQGAYISPDAPYATSFAAQNPYMTPAGYVVPQAAPHYVAQRVVSPAPVVARRAVSQRTYASERVAKPKRTWQKSAVLIGGSAAGGAGVGALIGGKKGAGIGALIGGGTAALYDQIKRR